MPETAPERTNSLGKASLVLGILSLFFVFSIGLCAGVGQKQGWLQLAGTILFLLGASSAFLGLMGSALGFFGLFGRNRPKMAAFVGLIFGVLSVVLFFAILNAVKP